MTAHLVSHNSNCRFRRLQMPRCCFFWFIFLMNNESHSRTMELFLVVFIPNFVVRRLFKYSIIHIRSLAHAVIISALQIERMQWHRKKSREKWILWMAGIMHLFAVRHSLVIFARIEMSCAYSSYGFFSDFFYYLQTHGRAHPHSTARSVKGNRLVFRQ